VSEAGVSATDSELILRRSAEGQIDNIVLNRGNKRNALSPPLLDAMRGHLETARHDASRIVVIRSDVENVFCAGFDIAYLGTGEEARGQAALYGCLHDIEQAPKITVAIADGIVVGGGNELFLCCDLRLATPRTSFRLTPARLGLVYSLEGMARFVRALGPTAAMEMFVAARQLSAEEALRIGLVTRIVADTASADAYCQELLANGPLAQTAMKRMIRVLADPQRGVPSDPAVLREIEQLRHEAAVSDDRKEALRAFSEKRPPVFTGR